MEKFDPHNSKYYLERWKENKLENLSKKNSQLLKQYISDMELGINTNGSKKGGRSSIKLVAMARQMQRLLDLSEQHCKVQDITKITEKQLHNIFSGMTQGKITRIDGKPYKSVGDYVARFKAFWHWYMKLKKKEGVAILDITEDLESTKKKRPEFVYFTDEDLEKMIKTGDLDTRVFMLFLFDTGIRCPTEAMNIRVSDFTNDFKELHIRDEISKTFGRNIKLMMCSEAIKNFIKESHLSNNDFVFTVQAPTMNKRLKQIGALVLGAKFTIGRKAGKDLTMYDFRHSSACYWLPRYKSRSALLYRFGWKKEEEIHYYTELLGMKDTISEEDMLLNTTKTEIEKELVKTKKEVKEMKSLWKKLESNPQFQKMLEK
jgi:integrase